MSASPEKEITYDLQRSLLIGSEKIEQVSWKIPIKWRVMKKMFRGTGEDERMTNFMAALLNLPPTTIDELDVMDYQAIMKEIEPFFVNIRDMQQAQSLAT